MKGINTRIEVLLNPKRPKEAEATFGVVGREFERVTLIRSFGNELIVKRRIYHPFGWKRRLTHEPAE